MKSSNTLTFAINDYGERKPDQDPWCPDNGAKVSIVNSSSTELKLWNIKNGCLLQLQGGGKVTEITIGPGSTWEGRAGAVGAKGQYSYDDGKLTKGMRNGTIDPS